MATRRFKRCDHRSWDPEAGRVSSRITRVVTSAIQCKGYTVHASKDEPQSNTKGDRTGHIAMHKRSAPRKLSGCSVASTSARTTPVPGPNCDIATSSL
jgi:hypothetical protein